MTEVYEFRVHHTDNTTSATYYTDRDCVNMEEWFGRSLEDFARGMSGRGFHYYAEDFDICGRRWTEHLWTRQR